MTFSKRSSNPRLRFLLPSSPSSYLSDSEAQKKNLLDYQGILGVNYGVDVLQVSFLVCSLVVDQLLDSITLFLHLCNAARVYHISIGDVLHFSLDLIFASGDFSLLLDDIV